MTRFRYPLILSTALLAGACGGTVNSSSCIPGVASNVTITVSGSTNTVLHGCGFGDGGLAGNGGGSGSGGGTGDGGGTGSGGGTDNGNGGGTTASGGGGGGTATGAGGGAPPAVTRGATVPYWEFEAESAKTNGTIIGPSRTFGDLSSEASGRKAVTLASVGQNVSFTTQAPANSIVVRYSVPDTTQSTAIDPQAATPTQTLGLYINGTRKASLQMTSRWSWTYGDADSQNAGSNSAGSGTAHHFYDETHLMF
ncbi:MAG TPA: hypothetical protein VIA18_32390, partial [Polyangia bacterium]|nr:hypothetical protein [Polyangia bacterium]